MKKLLIALMLLASFNVLAADPQSGTEFDRTAQTIPTDTPNKIEVIELFWYGCIHCYQMDPILAAWVKKLPADVVFKRIPGLPRADWAPMAKAYYAMEDLKLTEKLHTPLFDAIHKQKVLNPTDEAATIDWITKQSGLDRKKVDEAFKSFSMKNNFFKELLVILSFLVLSFTIQAKQVSQTEAITIANKYLEHVGKAEIFL